jgi:hypothetical protein
MSRGFFVRRSLSLVRKRYPQGSDHPKHEMPSVTVCIAAIAENRAIIGASDRMLSYGHVQSEGDQTKCVQAAPLIKIMVAGPTDLQTEILRNLDESLLQQEDVTALTVYDMALLYSEFCKQLHQARAEAAILMPLGLTYETFVTLQRHMAPDFIERVREQLQFFEPPGVQAIITGIDRRGPQIYAANNYQLSHRNAEGFATVGTGGWLAQSDFIFACHDRDRPYAETLSLVHSAKKRAEAAPHVGRQTDMFIIEEQGAGVGLVCEDVPAEHISQLDRLYRKLQKESDRVKERAEQRLQAWLDKAKPLDPESTS